MSRANSHIKKKTSSMKKVSGMTFVWNVKMKIQKDKFGDMNAICEKSV